jgi:hypothetical protein
MNVAWQTWVVAALSLGSFTVGLIAANTQALGITQPWLTIVVIPTVLTFFTLASNQLKTIGQPPPSTTRTVTEQTVVPPQP